MNFYSTPSLSHLLFSWPSSSSSSSTSSFSPISPLSFASSSNNRPSVSSSNTVSTSTSALSLWGNTILNDAVPLPFPSLSTSSSISLLRYFVSLSKNLFKLVFLEIEPNSRFNYSTITITILLRLFL
ncbi:Protein CIP2A [Bienertia sinuspersici]